MKNVFKRNKTYYLRLRINSNLKLYFNNKVEYIKSLQTNNINNAKIISKYLIIKFENIKKSVNMLSFKEIDNLVKEFKEIKFSDIVNRNNEMTIEEIDEQIKQLKNNEYKNLIKHEMGDIQKFLISKNEDFEFGLPQDLGEKLEEYIIQIKINALNEVKKSIKLEKINTNNNATKNLLDDVLDEFYLNEKAKRLQKEGERAKKTNINNFIKFLKDREIEYIEDVAHKDVVAFKDYINVSKEGAAQNTLDNILKNVCTFLNYCSDHSFYIKKITKGIRLGREEGTREPFLLKDIKLIFKSIDLLRLTPKGKKTKHYDVLELIIKIGLYTGARENEILQLTKNDIVEDEQSGIWCFYFNKKNNKKIKNISSIRKVPIHSKIEKEVLELIKKLENNEKLFKISFSTFSKDFSIFKTKLGFDETKVFHSFRNTLQEELKQKMVEFVMIDELVGHQVKQNKQSNAYTRSYSLENKKKVIELLDFKL